MFRFRTPRPARATLAEMLRHMEEGRFREARQALDGLDGKASPPPHVLWRLGRIYLRSKEPAGAVAPLSLFLERYPNHLDRAAVEHALAQAYAQLGRTAEAQHHAAQAKARRRKRPAP